MEKTAVDYYEEKIIELINLYVNGEIDVRELITRHNNIYYDIKEMEKQQIIDAFDEGQEYEYQYHINNTPKFDSKTYFAETYASKGSDDQFYLEKEMLELERQLDISSNKTSSQTERMYTKEEVMDAISMARQINYLNQDYEIMLSIKLK